MNSTQSRVAELVHTRPLSPYGFRKLAPSISSWELGIRAEKDDHNAELVASFMALEIERSSLRPTYSPAVWIKVKSMLAGQFHLATKDSAKVQCGDPSDFASLNAATNQPRK